MDKAKAKVMLALRAVYRLASSEEDPWTMRELFAPGRENEAENPILVKYGTQKTWQREFIQRLIDHGVVEKIRQGAHHVAYAGVEKNVLNAILSEVHGDDLGKTIKWLIFPGSYDVPELFRPDEPEPEPEPMEPESSVEDDATLASLQLLTEVSEHLVEIRQAHKNLSEQLTSLDSRISSLEKLGDIFNRLPDAIGESVQAVHDNSFDKLEKGVHQKLDAMGVALSAMITECRRLTVAVDLSKQITQFKSQIDVWNSIVQSIHSQGGNFAAGLETILDVVGKMEEDAAESIR